MLASETQRQLLRIRIVLEAADGFGTREIARELDTTPTTVSLWRGRFARQRLDGLEDLPRSGTPPIYSEATDQRIRAVLERPPPKAWPVGTDRCVRVDQVEGPSAPSQGAPS